MTPTRNGNGGARVPPHDLGAEEALLGAALYTADVVDRYAGTVNADDFYKPAHAHTWATCLALRADGRPTDPVSVQADLTDRGLMSAVGVDVLQRLAANPMPASSTARYAEIVTTRARARRLIGVAGELAELGYGGQADEGLDRLEQLTDHLRRVGDTAISPTIDELLAGDEPDHVWLEPGALERGERVVVVADEGAGKSTLLRQWAVQAGAGIHWFTNQPIVPLTSLIVDCENTRRQVRREIRHLRVKAGARLEPGRVRLEVRPEGIDLLDPEDVAWLTAKIEAARPDILFIGPIYKLSFGDDERPERIAKQVTRVIDRIRVRYDVAVILEAHQGHAQGVSRSRPGRPIDSSLWLRWPEFGINLETDKRTGLVTLKRFRGDRDNDRVWPQQIRRGGDWPWTVADDTTPRQRIADPIVEAKAAVLEVLQVLARPLNRNELVAATRGANYRIRDAIITQAADELANDHRIHLRAGARRARIYSLDPPDDGHGDQAEIDGAGSEAAEPEQW